MALERRSMILCESYILIVELVAYHSDRKLLIKARSLSIMIVLNTNRHTDGRILEVYYHLKL